jgi:hypothetical protein
MLFLTRNNREKVEKIHENESMKMQIHLENLFQRNQEVIIPHLIINFFPDEKSEESNQEDGSENENQEVESSKKRKKLLLKKCLVKTIELMR